jgi:mRNA interferase MazF
VVVVGLPHAIQSLPYAVLIVVPLTRTRFTGPLFPVFPLGAGGLPAESTALVYQVLALDIRRVKGRIGTLTAEEYQPIQEGLRQLFDFPEKAEQLQEKEETCSPDPTGEEGE